MASFRKVGKNWHYRFVDENGKQVGRKGCPDRRETERMTDVVEAANIRHGYVDGKARGYRDQEARPLAEHLDDFHAMLSAKNGPGKHASVSRNRAERIIDLAGFKKISDLSLSKALDALARLRADGFAVETINHHVRAVKAFSRWLWKDGRTREHLLAHLAISNPRGPSPPPSRPDPRRSRPARQGRRTWPGCIGDDRTRSSPLLRPGPRDRVPSLGTGQPDP
jgi:hypothetical protein